MSALAIAPGAGSRPASADDQASSLRRLVDALGGAGGAIALGRADAPIAESAGAHAPVVAIASGKGGVGKSNIAVNLAVALSRASVRTTLLDGDLGLANADVLCGVPSRGDLSDVVAGRKSVEEILVRAPGGFMLAPGAAGVASMADLDDRAGRRLLDAVERLTRGADLLALDCGAGIGRGALSLFGSADLGLIVTTPEPTAITDAYAFLKCAAAGGDGVRPMPMARARLVVNQARDREEALAVHARVSAVASRFLGAPIALAGWVPSDPAVGRAVRARQPFIIAAPGSGAARRIEALSGVVREAVGLAPAAPVRADSGARGVTAWLARARGVSRRP